MDSFYENITEVKISSLGTCKGNGEKLGSSKKSLLRHFRCISKCTYQYLSVHVNGCVRRIIHEKRAANQYETQRALGTITHGNSKLETKWYSASIAFSRPYVPKISII